MRRIGRLIGIATLMSLLLAANSACAATGSGSRHADATRFLQTVYARYATHGHPITVNSKQAADVYAPSLLDLMRLDQQAVAGEAGVLDADPICACQDYDIRALKLDFQPKSADKLSATARFMNLGAAQTVHLDLIKTAGGWRIADIHTVELPSLVSSLKDEIASAGAQQP